MRLSLKNRFLPHIPLAKDAPKPLKQRIDAKLNIVRDITFEPNLLNPNDSDSKRSNYCLIINALQSPLDSIKLLSISR